jgi:integrase
MARKRRGRGEGAIYQRADGLWTASINLGIDGNGKRRRRTVYGRTKQEAQQKLRELQNLADAGHAIEPTERQTLGRFLTRWLEDAVRISRSPNTYESYECVVRCHINRLLGGASLAKLTPAQVQGMYAQMEREGAKARTRELAHAVLRRAMVQAVKWGLRLSNPCDGVERPRVAKREMRTLTPEQTATLLETARDHRLSALFVLAVATGMRQGELFGLSWGDIDLDGAAVNVQRSLEELDGNFRLKPPKSKKGLRRIDLPSFAVEALREHRKLMLAEGHISAPVFCSREGTWLYKSNFTRYVFKPMLRKAGLLDVRFHDLRHGHATMMLFLGEHPKVVQERLGHAQISVTLDTYSHVLPGVHKQAASNFDRAFRNLGKGQTGASESPQVC